MATREGCRSEWPRKAENLPAPAGIWEISVNIRPKRRKIAYSFILGAMSG
jgi:hypothetical protein